MIWFAFRAAFAFAIIWMLMPHGQDWAGNFEAFTNVVGRVANVLMGRA